MMSGQSAIEMALVLPAVVLLLVVVADFGRVFYASIAIADAARAGVQYGAQNYAKAADYPNIVQAALNDGTNVVGLSATASDFCMCSGQLVSCGATQCSGQQLFVKVTASVKFTPIIKYPGLPSIIPLSSTAIMEVQ